MLPKAKGDGKVVEQKTLNKIMLNTILKTHQTMRDLSSTVWDTLLIKASAQRRTTCRSRRKLTQRKSDKIGRDTHEARHSCGHTWAWSSLFSRGRARWEQERHRAKRPAGPDWSRSHQLYYAMQSEHVKRLAIAQSTLWVEGQ